MEEQRIQSQDHFQKALLMSLLVVACNLFFPIILFGDFTLLFGSTFVILSLQLLPLRFASLVFIASLISLFQSGQLWQMLLIHSLEFLAIALLIRRKILLIVAATIFWFTLGIPLLWISINYADFAYSEISTLYTLHKALNSLLCAAIATSLLALIPFSQQNKALVASQNKLASNIFALCASTMMVPLLIVSFIWSNDSAKEYEKLIADETSSKAVFVSELSQNFIQKHVALIKQNANLISLNTPDFIVQQSMLLGLAESSAFNNLGRSNEQGLIVEMVPEKTNPSLSEIPASERSVEDRTYFLEAKRTMQAVVSDTLISRGHTQAPMLTIAAPFYQRSQFKGTIFGSINLSASKELENLFTQSIQGAETIITDRNGNVIFSSIPELVEPLSEFVPLNNYSLASRVLLSTQVGERGFIYARQINNFDWRIYVLVDSKKLLNHTEHVYFVISFSLLVVISAFLFFAYNLSSRITKPLTELINTDGEVSKPTESILGNSEEFDFVEQKLKRSKNLVQNFENRIKQQVNEKTVELEQLNLQLAAQAREDGLTQLYNRSGFDELAVNAIKTNYRMGQAFSLALIDIDHFKKINDNYGHPFGDKCLRSFAALLQRNCKRETDIIGRYGGEEFIILMSGKDVETHHRIINNIHQQTIGMQIKAPDTGENISFTVSVGICSILGNVNMSLYEIVKLADEELYKCKRSGRNKISIVKCGYSDQEE